MRKKTYFNITGEKIHPLVSLSVSVGNKNINIGQMLSSENQRCKKSSLSQLALPAFAQIDRLGLTNINVLIFLPIQDFK